MKIINFKSGLGNQIFYYLMVLFLREKYPHEKIYGYYNPQYLKWHNGLEIQNVLDVELPPAPFQSKLIAWGIRLLAKVSLFKRLKADDKTFSIDAIYFDGYWQNKKFFLDNIKKLKYRNESLDPQNKTILDNIKNSSSVSIHIRRGDYLTPVNQEIYGNICTIDYYQKAIDYIYKKIEKPYFFVFSNDIEWVKSNLKISNASFISNNTGKNNWIDMYLMSHCKANIIANSSFSYWGAMLNKNKNIIVIFPKKWTNKYIPDIFPDEWVGIN